MIIRKYAKQGKANQIFFKMQQDILTNNDADNLLHNWREEEKRALELLQITGALRFDRSVELVLFRRDIHGTSTSTLLSNHNHAAKYGLDSLSIDTTLELAKAIAHISDLAPSKLDIGKLAVEWTKNKRQYENIQEFVLIKLGGFIGKDSKNEAPKDVVLYGFGRIGRLLARRLVTDTGRGEQLRLKAIVIRPKLSDHFEEAKKRASLLQTDSVHGDFNAVIDIAADGKSLTINGNLIHLIYAKSPADVQYADYGINSPLVLDNTGVWRDRAGLGQHIQSGASQAMLTAPAKDDIPNVVYGVNHESLNLDETIYSAASCTTNAIAPVLQVVMDSLGIEKGHIETIHAYTNDQNLLDNFHKKPRRGRGAPVNMVLTTTGAAKAVTKVNPALKGKLTGNAIRVPTPNVSLAILNLTLEKETSVEALNDILKNAAFHGDLVEQIHYSDSTEYVSSNAIGMNTTSVVDAPSTIVSEDGKSVTIYAWYDNEYGYCCQVMRLAKHIAKVRRHVYF